MTNKARTWIGLTLFIVLCVNYGVIGFPLYRRTLALRDKATIAIIKKMEKGNFLQRGNDEYILEVLRKERASIDVRLLILNCVAVSLTLGIASWTIFGLITHRRK